MNKRIAEVRRSTGLNQQDFAARIGLTKNFVSLLETGNRIPSDRTISDICREFNVNETWLRTGEGEPFIQLSRDAQLSKLVGEALRREAPSDQQRFLHALLGATPEELQAIASFAKRLADEYKKEDSQ